MAVEFVSVPVRVEPETTDSVSLSFDVPPELREEFRHIPGQHLVLRATIDDEDVRRSYSICSSAASDVLRVGIKRIPDGVFSTYATTTLTTGDTVEVMRPIGEFGYSPDPAVSSRLVAVAAAAADESTDSTCPSGGCPGCRDRRSRCRRPSASRSAGSCARAA